MARVTESELLAIWRPLAGGGLEEGWRSIAMAEYGSCRVRAARRFPGNEEGLLIGFPSLKLPAQNQLPQGRGFRVERVNLGDAGRGLGWLSLVRQSAGSLELFAKMVVDILASLEECAQAGEEVLFQRYLGRIRAWQDFMRKGRDGLSPEEELGLIGELEFLSQLLGEDIPLYTAVDAWKGPLDGLHDYELGNGSIEIKTTTASEGFPAKIDSLEQLDDSLRCPLYLAGVRLQLNEDGLTLPQQIARMRELVKSDPEATRYLENALLHAGYLDAHADLYTRPFLLAELVIHRVNDSFPRLTPFNVPIGVFRVKYEIDLGLVQSEKVGIKDVLQEIGVF
ncbi:PD-(D/E)XK motif protein [Pseudomonas aeruginosa]|uniref:PD-(D/E)XK motif protein n=1 Tax=Pseudomonas aeruginosa TaxID=287 RepID=UPI00149562D0|nr:PD-(D/E)XK motif protein [Pseudomonas aeruginosa]NPS39811.1 PD-(D/E)XK motif protein [Pseudomonas aeruginosa]NPS85106.1 PD-(D/E)XK motif protein [Pseudomonas aeruginosa]